MHKNKNTEVKHRPGKNKGKKYNMVHATPRTMSDEDYKKYYDLANQPKLLKSLQEGSAAVRLDYEKEQLAEAANETDARRIQRRWDKVNKQPKVWSQGILPVSRKLGLVADVQTWTCLHGHRFQTSQMLLIRNSTGRLPQGCPVCSRIEAGQAMLTPNMYRQRLQDEIEWCEALEDYAGSEVLIKHQCHYCHATFMASPGSILAGGASCHTKKCHSIAIRSQIRADINSKRKSTK